MESPLAARSFAVPCQWNGCHSRETREVAFRPKHKQIVRHQHFCAEHEAELRDEIARHGGEIAS